VPADDPAGIARWRARRGAAGILFLLALSICMQAAFTGCRIIAQCL